jgi:hypothetical protein
MVLENQVLEEIVELEISKGELLTANC